jgi:alkaline phosphatase D
MKRLLLGLILSLLAQPLWAQSIQRIAFGSCADQHKAQPIWEQVLAAEPQLFVFLGDNVYADTDDPAELRTAYEQLAAQPGFQRLRSSTEIIATWDDHDYGQNDIGADYVAKEASRQIMLNFFNEPADSPRRTQEGGIYDSWYFGEQGQRVQVILLDLRWGRSELIRVTSAQRRLQRQQQNRGPYEANLAADAVLMAESQWQWLERELQQPADLRIIGSSIQFLAEFTGWETWANYPRERQRMIELLARYQQEPILFISGDVHWAEYSLIEETANDWPLVELTSSGLTEEWSSISPNRHRVGEAFAEANFGLLEIDWGGEWPAVQLSISNVAGQRLIDQRLEFGD